MREARPCLPHSAALFWPRDGQLRACSLQLPVSRSGASWGGVIKEQERAVRQERARCLFGGRATGGTLVTDLNAAEIREVLFSIVDAHCYLCKGASGRA